jgi:hypothetical protein
MDGSFEEFQFTMQFWFWRLCDWYALKSMQPTVNYHGLPSLEPIFNANLGYHSFTMCINHYKMDGTWPHGVLSMGADRLHLRI